MGQSARVTIQIFAALTMTWSAGARAGDNGHCLGLYQKAEDEMFKLQQQKRGDAKAMAGVAVAFGVGTAVVAKKSPIVAGILGLGTALAYFAGRHQRDEAQQITRDYGTKALEFRSILSTYRDVAPDGLADDEDSAPFLARLSVAPEHQGMVMRHFAEEMESGALCDGDSVKSLGEIVVELKDYEAKQSMLF